MSEILNSRKVDKYLVDVTICSRINNKFNAVFIEFQTTVALLRTKKLPCVLMFFL